MIDTAANVGLGPAGRTAPALARSTSEPPNAETQPSDPISAGLRRACRRIWPVRRTAANCIVGQIAARRSVVLGLGLFVLLAPLAAIARQATILAVAWLVGATTDLIEDRLLALLPVDPVYGGAGLRVLGGIEPRGLAVAGPPGALLHWLVPAAFLSPGCVAPGAMVSALVDPGVTVLARVLTALLATTILLAVLGVVAGRLRRRPWRIAATLLQIWILLDLAQETNLGIRDLEATGLPFALAALAPVDAQGQRVLLTTSLEALPDLLVASLSAATIVVICLLSAVLIAILTRSAVRLGRTAARRRPVAALPRRTGWRRHAGTLPDLRRLAALVASAAILSASPVGALAEGELAVLPPAPVAAHQSASRSLPMSQASETTAPLATPPPAPTTVAQATVTEPAGSVVAVEGSGYAFILRVDGKPTIVKGMGYNPWYASLPVEERRQRYRRDFSAMREIGVNTIEGWFQDQFDEVTLDEAQRQGLKVIMPFELNQDYDYSDPGTKAFFRQQITDWVLRYRDNPAVLMWGPGNEVMHRLIFPTAVQGQRDPAREKRADDFAAFDVELMDLIRSLDANHPVIYRDAEDLYFARFRQALLQDGVPRPWFVYGTNVYTQKLADVIDRWPTEGVDAPLLVSELSPGGSGPAERPGMFGWYWSTIRAHPQRVIGGVVYTWTTQGPEDLDRVFGLTDGNGVPVDGSIDALRQLFAEDTSAQRGPP